MINDLRLGIYRHFKGKDYKVLGTALHSETKEMMVVYLALYEPYDLWVRPLSMFQEEVDKPELDYKGPRFKLVRETFGLGN